jgi:hypothetical protein
MPDKRRAFFIGGEPKSEVERLGDLTVQGSQRGLNLRRAVAAQPAKQAQFTESLRQMMAPWKLSVGA